VEIMAQQFNRGEIWIVDLGEQKGSLQGGKRPAIIVSNNSANLYSSVIHVMPATSQPKKYIPTHVGVPSSSGLLKFSVAMGEQIKLIDKKDILEKIGFCNEYTTRKINQAIEIQFGLVEVKRNNVAYA